jgi:hypothetical protein
MMGIQKYVLTFPKSPGKAIDFHPAIQAQKRGPKSRAGWIA